MAMVLRWSRGLLQRTRRPTCQVPTSNFLTQTTAEKIEEEKLPWYKPNQFYPVHIGDVFQSRYRVLGKLGYGAYSTVWLCKDLRGRRYVTLKVCERDSSQALREVEVYRHLNSMTTSHIGCLLVRTALDDFAISTSGGQYQFLVHEPLGMSLSALRAKSPSNKLPEGLLKATLIHVLHALDFLHTEAGVVHTDLQEKNILLGIEDETILFDFEQAELSEPSFHKNAIDGMIYRSRSLRIPKKHGRPVLCDFGEARFGAAMYHEDIQPYLYRAPEVLLRMTWDSKVDIWNFGVMIWDLFQNKHMFDARDASKENSNLHHMAEMVAILGLPPRNFLHRSAYASEFFDEQGNWKGAITIPPMSLEQSETNLHGKDKVLFLQFMQKMLCWLPEERATARELLQDAWLTGSSPSAMNS